MVLTTEHPFKASPLKPALVNKLKETFKNTLEFNISLKNKSYLNIGGTAAYFLRISDATDLIEAIKFLKEYNIEYFILGRGTNTLIREGMIYSVVIELARTRTPLAICNETHEIEYPSGMLLMQAIKTALDHKMGGMEFAIGIPGSIGGAVRMNAGTSLGEVKDVLKTARVLRNDKNSSSDTSDVLIETPERLGLGYRTSNIESGEVVISARFSLRALSSIEVADAKRFVLEQLKKRKQTQPLGVPSLGSTFKNPPALNGKNRYAAQLIEAAGLKGTHIGGIHISTLHANFMVNNGRGTSHDAYTLLNHIQQTVYKKFNIYLEPEIALLGWQ